MVFCLICIIFSRAQLFNTHFLSFKLVPIRSLVFYIIVYFKSHILLLPSFTSFYLLLSSSYFHFKFYFFSCYDSFPIVYSYYFSPLQPLKTIFLVISHLTFLFPFLKYPHSLSTFINICSLVVDMVVVSSFLQFLILDLHCFYTLS